MTEKIMLPEAKQGDIFLYRNGTSLLTKLIRLFTTSDYNHAGIYWGYDKYKGHIVAESLKNGFVFTFFHDLDFYFANGVDIYRYKKKIHIESLKNKILENIGVKYGFFDLFKILIYVFTRIQFKRQSERLICSEAVAKVYRDSKHDLFLSTKNLDYVTPSDLSNCKKLQKIW